MLQKFALVMTESIRSSAQMRKTVAILECRKCGGNYGAKEK